MQKTIIILWLILALLPAACKSKEPTPALATATQAPELATAEQVFPSFEMTSAAFAPGDAIPQKHTCDDLDISPALSWAAPPEGTQSLALIVDDPDAPGKTWVHWVLYDLPPDLRELPKDMTQPGTQGRNNFGKTGYGGPCPPKGKNHRYFFKLYAIDIELDLAPGATKSQVLDAIAGHVLAQAELMGTYTH